MKAVWLYVVLIAALLLAVAGGDAFDIQFTNKELAEGSGIAAITVLFLVVIYACAVWGLPLAWRFLLARIRELFSAIRGDK